MAVRQPLDGLVVVDLSSTLTSAYVTMVLADHGAEVIQIERPGGSSLRQLAGWPFWMRGKKSIALDLYDEADREVARRLAVGSDVVVEALGAGVAARLGLDYDSLVGDNHRLVHTSITGFGHTGPFSHLRGYEAVVLAKSGSMWGTIAPNRPGEPVMVTPFGASFAGALLALQGTLAALHERERSGWGQRVDATLIQGMMVFDPFMYFNKMLSERWPDAFAAVGAPTADRRTPTTWLTFGLMNGYSKDGKWLQFAHATFRQFDAFVRALGLEEKLKEDEWRDAPNSPDDAVRDRWWTLMLEGVRSRTVEEWQEVFDADPHVFAEVYRSAPEIHQHPQIIHNQQTAKVDVPGLGTVTEMGPLVIMTKTPAAIDKAPPAVDQHGAELRRRPAPAASPAPGPAPGRALPLEGVTVVDVGSFYAGPFGSAMLADHGATVIHIEPFEGDPIRFQMPMPESSGVRVTQGKKSVAVDTTSERGQQIVAELIRKADIVLHTYRGGVAERMNLDAERMLQLNPDLVYHHGVGYGVTGPYIRRASLAPTIAAASGFARRAGGGGPEGVDLTLEEIKDATVTMGGVQPGNPDGFSASAVAVGMLLGLYARDRGAGGQETMTSMLNTMGHAMGEATTFFEGAPAAPETVDEHLGFSSLYRLYRASDAWIVLCAPSDRQWERLVGALPGGSELAEDPRFATSEARARHDTELAARLAEILATRTAQQWEVELSAAGVGCAEVVEFQGALGQGLLEPGHVGDQLGLLTPVHHPIFEEHLRTVQLVRLSRGDARLLPGCTIGQHTDEVLRDMLGYDDDELAKLRADNVIA